MKTYFRFLGGLVLIAFFSLLMNSCGGGGDSAPQANPPTSGGDSTPQANPPTIKANLISFPSGSVPAGFKNNASVIVLDPNNGNPISTAIVTMNSTTLTYNTTNQDYEGMGNVAPGTNVTLTVSVGGAAYTTSVTQFTSYPTISSPTSGAAWLRTNQNTVTWSGGAPIPTNNSGYALGVLDAASPNGYLVWPAGNKFFSTSFMTTSYAIPANSLTAGNRFVFAGIGASYPITSAASGSYFTIGGFTYVPITVGP